MKSSTQLLSLGLLAFVTLLTGIASAKAHQHTAPWLDENTLDNGLYVQLQHPRVIRTPGPIDIDVILCNVAGKQDLTLKAVNYSTSDGRLQEHRQLDQTLTTQQPLFQQYKNALEDMHNAAHSKDVTALQQATQASRYSLQAIAAATIVDHYTIPTDLTPTTVNTSLDILVDIELEERGHLRTIHREVRIPVESPLPNGAEFSQRWTYDTTNKALKHEERLTTPRDATGTTDTTTWYAGDQHLHTTYSLDALALEGTEENVTDYAATAELMGYNWIIITDHSNVHTTWSGVDYYTADQFNAGTAQAAAYTASHALLALYGEEMGAGQTGFWDLPSHYLAHPHASDSTGYLANPSSGLVFGLANCESEQTIIDRVNNAGGMGFIAHPFDSGTLSFAEWNFGNGAVGWSGLEIWSDTNGQIKDTDDQAFAKWHELLNAINAPQQGTLADRPGFPNKFPAGLGNSDAHLPGLIGITFSYAWMPDISRANVTDALMQGRCVASNGPLLFGELNGANIGEVAYLLDGDNSLNLTLSTTSEFGPVGDYTVTVYVNGSIRTTIPATGDPTFSMQVELTNLDLSWPDKFVTMRADSQDGTYHAIANPIWLQYVEPGDANADGQITLTDFQSFSACMTGPGATRTPSCDIMDFDRDTDVDLADFKTFSTNLTNTP